MLSKRTKRTVLGFLAVVLVVVFLLVSMARYMESRRERQRYDAQRAELKPPEPVSRVIEERPLRRERKFSADVNPWTEAKVPAEMAGTVVETLVEAGQPVKTGDVLVRLDDTRAKIAVELAKARYAEAMRLLSEAERLQKSRVVSQTAFEAAASEARVSKAQLADAEDLLARHAVKAPFEGIVNRRMVDVGDAVNPNEEVAEVVDVNKLRVVFDVADTDLSAFQPGREVSLRLLGGGPDVLKPTVRFVSRSADPATRLFRVEAELENPGIPGGLQGIVDAEVQVFPSGPVVPAAAVRFSGRDAMVLKDDGGPVLTRIVVGPEIEGVFPVLEGLKAGDRVFIR